MKAIGPHQHAEESEGRDINGRIMVSCRDCETCAHAGTVEEAEADLARTPCVPNCANCKSLRHSLDQRPAVPLNGTCNDVLHVCPICQRRWWQMNTHFHLWQQVTSDAEWESLNRQSVGAEGYEAFGLMW